VESGTRGAEQGRSLPTAKGGRQVVPVRGDAGHRNHGRRGSFLRQDLPRLLHLDPRLGLCFFHFLGAPSLPLLLLLLVLLFPLAVGEGGKPAHGARWRVDVAVGGFAHAEGGAIGPRLPDGLHLHVQPGLLGAGDVEGGVAVGFVTLDASPGAALLADVTGQLPAGGRDVLDAVDGLQEDGVGKAHLRDPEGTDHMCPAPIVRLLEGPPLVRAEGAVHGSRG